MNAQHPIGIFDSGLGGLTVMKALIERLPHEKILYFGDTARVPYGNKSAETVVRYSREIAEFLCSQGIKLLVIACNTATAYALESIQSEMDIPVVGVIAPGVQRALSISRNKSIAVLGTKATMASGAYQLMIQSLCPDAEIWNIPCPLFVPLVEENFLQHPSARLIAEEYLRPLAKTDADTILLGCTHYPMMKTLIQETIGNSISIVDSASTCAKKVEDILRRDNLANTSNLEEHCFYVSDDPLRFQESGSRFLGKAIPETQIYQADTLKQLYPHNFKTWV